MSSHDPSGPADDDEQAWERAWMSARLPRKPNEAAQADTRARKPTPSSAGEDNLRRTIMSGTPDEVRSLPPQGPLPSDPVAPPPIEVEIVRDERIFGRGDDGSVAVNDWAIIEIWTRNRIYLLNSRMICIEVISRDTGKPDLGHALLGTMCVGGVRQYRSSMHMSHPLPIPGTEASFRVPPRDPAKSRSHKSISTTKVERVILRVLLASVARSVNADMSDVTSTLLRPKR